LLSDQGLADAIGWAERNSNRLYESEQKFLKKCKDRQRLGFWLNLLVTLVAVGSIICAGYLFWSLGQLKKNYSDLKIANYTVRAQQLGSDAALAYWRLNNDELAGLLAVQAYKFLAKPEFLYHLWRGI